MGKVFNYRIIKEGKGESLMLAFWKCMFPFIKWC